MALRDNRREAFPDLRDISSSSPRWAILREQNSPGRRLVRTGLALTPSRIAQWQLPAGHQIESRSHSIFDSFQLSRRRTIHEELATRNPGQYPSERIYSRLRLADSLGCPIPGRTSCSTTPQASYPSFSSSFISAGKSTSPSPSSQKTPFLTAWK